MADVSAERVHDGILTREMLARDAALLTDSVREAGALALSLFRTELKNWTKGASSPVSEADIRTNDLEFRYGVNAPTLRIEGLTLGGR